MGFGWQEIDKILDLGYIRVAGLHHECKPGVPNHLSPLHHDTCIYVCKYVCMYICTVLPIKILTICYE